MSQPIYIGPANCEALVGLNWRRVKQCALRLNVKCVKIGRTWVVPSEAFQRALAKEDPNEDPADKVRRIING